jgi:hypothetical protein
MKGKSEENGRTRSEVVKREERKESDTLSR